MKAIKYIFRDAAKAAVAAVTPILAVAITDLATELEVLAQGGIAAAATTALVWLTPNRPQDG